MIMKKLSILLIGFIMINFIHACKEDPTKPQFSLTGDFDTKLFKSVLASEPADKNVVISPISISTVTKMIMAGADGKTKEEIIKALDENGNAKELMHQTKTFLDWLDTRRGQPTIALHNAFFYDSKRFVPSKEYTTTLKEQFYAEAFAEDFNDEENALSTINDWVSDKTNTRIPKILENISSDEIMFLLNALYLKADWAQPFDTASTRDGSFTLENGGTIETPFMFADNSFSTYTDQELEALALPYKDNEIAMFFIKPKSGSVNQLIENFDFEQFMKIKENLTEGRNMVYVPRFKVQYDNKTLKNNLEEVGIKDAFTSNADLTKMGDVKNLMVSRVIHKTYLTIDEKGTEGAAVTAGGVAVTSMPPVMRFDSPFLIVLADKASNNLLFIGRISNPSQE
jgi:serine protease inhibitor